MAGKEPHRPYAREDDHDAGLQAFQGRHRSFSDRLERFLMQLVILGLVALVLVQALQVIPPLRRQMNLVDALEGITANERNAWSQSGAAAGAGVAQPLTVTILLVNQRSAPEARLLIDGKPAGSFTGSSVTANVGPGQIITLDGTRYQQALTFRVVGALGVINPELGTTITTYRNQQRLGEVQVR